MVGGWKGDLWVDRLDGECMDGWVGGYLDRWVNRKMDG